MDKQLNRRRFLELSAAAGIAGAAGAKEKPMAEENADKPNVLLIHTDQHRIDCLGCYGNPDIRTPNIDALAAEGMRFENSFCPYPVCTPSRYSLLSSQYVFQHRGWDNHCTLHPDIPTFPKVMRDAGYRTKAVGKMHFTPTYLDVGFDEMVLAEQDGPGRWDDDYHRFLRDEGLIDYNDLEDQRREYRAHARDEYWEHFGALVNNLPEEACSTRWIAGRAVETLENWTSSGNLLMTGFIKPHHPFDPPAAWADRYDPEKLTLLPGWTESVPERDLRFFGGYFPNKDLTEKSLRRVMAYYYATIEEIDNEVGRMVGVLKKKGIYDNTLIVFTADHGEYLGFHHLLLKGNFMYDPVIQVPLILRYPDKRKAGQVLDGLVSNADVAPSILSGTGCAVPESMQGSDLAAGNPEREWLFAEYGRGQQVMARTHTEKLILSDKRRPSLYFNLQEDPLEITNRLDDPDCEEAIGKLRERILGFRPPEKISKVYLDEMAPVIDQPNVPDRHDNHRENMIAYCKKKMQEAGSGII
jgi:arylsulfatase